jgi:hypothetical protein
MVATAPPDDLLAAAALAAAATARPAGRWRRRLAGYGDARVHGGRVLVGERSWDDAAIRPEATARCA